MNVDPVLLPGDLKPVHLIDRSVVVFDVLRATTSITAALGCGVSEVRVFGGTSNAASAAKAYGAGSLLCGEEKCLPPAGFDLGNSPAAFNRQLHAGRTAFLSTTNGTRAIIAAQGAAVIFAGALINASAVAARLKREARDVTLLCAGTGGKLAIEDLVGAGAVFDALLQWGPANPASDTALLALTLFRGIKSELSATLRQTQGGKNIIAAKLEADIPFCAALDSTDVVGVVRDDPLRIVTDG